MREKNQHKMGETQNHTGKIKKTKQKGIKKIEGTKENPSLITKQKQSLLLQPRRFVLFQLQSLRGCLFKYVSPCLLKQASAHFSIGRQLQVKHTDERKR